MAEPNDTMQPGCGPIEARLLAEIEKRFAGGMKNFHVSWGDEAGSMTREDRAEQTLKCFEEIDRWGALTDEQKMRIQIADAYAEIYEAIRHCRSDIRDIAVPMTPEREKLSEIFGLLESALMLLGNWVSHEEASAVRARLYAPPTEPTKLGERSNTDRIK